MAKKGTKKRRKRGSRLNRRDLDLPQEQKAKKRRLKGHEIDYESFKTKLGKKYANYLVLGKVQPWKHWLYDEWHALVKKKKLKRSEFLPYLLSAGELVMVKARSYEEAFWIYYKRASQPFTGGIGEIKTFKPKKRKKEYYFDGTTFIQRLKVDPNGQEFKIARLNLKVLFLEVDNKELPTNHPLHPKEKKRRIGLAKAEKERKKKKRRKVDE